MRRPMERTDPDRTAEALAGDARALDWLVGQWLPQVFAWCARLGAPDPQEAASDVVLLLLHRHARVRSVDHLPAWLWTACRRVVANQRRLAWWQRWLPGFALESWPAPGATDQSTDQRELGEQVARALDRLDPPHREVLVLCCVEERSIAEAAALLGVPPGTVKSRLFAARARFAAAWERQ